MAANDGWAIIHSKDDNKLTLRDSLEMKCSGVPSMQDYFEEIDAIYRKCRICSVKIKYIASNGGASMKGHLRTKHFIEWTKIEPFMKTRNRTKSTKGTKNTFDQISSDVTESDDSPNSFRMSRIDKNDHIIEEDYGNAHYSMPKKRTKFKRRYNYDSMEHNNDMNASSNENETTDVSDTTQMCNKCGVAKDEYGTFGEFIANELRTVKNDQLRRKMKRALQKCLLELTEEEDDAMQSKCGQEERKKI